MNSPTIPTFDVLNGLLNPFKRIIRDDGTVMLVIDLNGQPTALTLNLQGVDKALALKI